MGVEMFKKALVSYIVIGVIVLYLMVIALGYTNDLETKRIEYQTLQLIGWNYELNEVDSNKVKFTYTLTLINYDSKDDFIKLVKPDFKEEIVNIIEYDDYIVVNKEIKPNEEMGISWDIIVNTAGLKNVDVKEIRSYLTSVTVSARNQNAYYTFYSYN